MFAGKWTNQTCKRQILYISQKSWGLKNVLWSENIIAGEDSIFPPLWAEPRTAEHAVAALYWGSHPFLCSLFLGTVWITYLPRSYNASFNHLYVVIRDTFNYVYVPCDTIIMFLVRWYVAVIFIYLFYIVASKNMVVKNYCMSQSLTYNDSQWSVVFFMWTNNNNSGIIKL